MVCEITDFPLLIKDIFWQMVSHEGGTRVVFNTIYFSVIAQLS